MPKNPNANKSTAKPSANKTGSRTQIAGKGSKPDKPYPDFPLTANGNGQWSKKIRGKVYYFGSWVDADGALVRYIEVKDDLFAGRMPRKQSDGLSVVDLVNRFLTAKNALVEGGELSRRTWNDYKRTCGLVIETFGRNRLVEDLRSDDFETFRAELAKTRGLHALAGEIQQTRTLFKYGFDAELIDRPVRFGPAFKRPSKKVFRRARNAEGPKLFAGEEIRAMLEAAGQPLRAAGHHSVQRRKGAG